ncbi:MAG: hypothetical protein JNK64_07890 [Myxococcales bacterium]|nr:hypothetical protein [Myxococcales bacterium]
MQLDTVVDDIYRELARLRHRFGDVALRDCTSRAPQPWPRRGVYLFFETGEVRTDGTARVVRVGTHAVGRGVGSTLWSRLRAHRGGRDGSGSHRASVFRRHVGAALIARDAVPPQLASDWANKRASPDVRLAERKLEAQVSEHIGAMQVLWLDVDDAPGPTSERAYLEQNLIGALSTSPDAPSTTWLGRFTCVPEIVASGLWNIDYVGRVPEPDLLRRLRVAVERTIR